MKQIIRPRYGVDYFAGDIVFVCRTSIMSEGITWFENLQEKAAFAACHVYMMVDAERAIESGAFGVRYFNPTRDIEDIHTQVVINRPENIKDFTVRQLLSAAEQMHNAHWMYDYTGLVIGGPIEVIADWVCKKVGCTCLRRHQVPFHMPHSRVCSAFVSDLLRSTTQYCNIPLFIDWHVTRISPNMLWNQFPFEKICRRAYEETTIGSSCK